MTTKIEHSASQLAAAANIKKIWSGIIYNVKVYGAIGNGVIDDTAAFQAAINAAFDAGGGIVYVPSGNFRITSQLLLKEGVSLTGTGSRSQNEQGSCLYIDNSINNAIVLHTGSSVVGINFFYPNQTNTDIGIAVPYVFPPLFSLNIGGVNGIFIQDCFFTNVYYVGDFTNPHGGLTVKDCSGYAMYRGFVTDNCTDIERYENIHFNPALWDDTFAPSDRSQWTRANGIMFHVKRSDWIKITNCFCWGYSKGIYVQDGTTGSIGSGDFSNCGFDLCLTPIHIDASNAWGISITNCSLVAQDPITPSTPHTAIQVDNFMYGITIKGCKFWSVTGGAVSIISNSGAPKNVEIANNQFISWGTSATVSQVQYAIAMQNIYNTIVSGNICKGTNASYVRGFSFNSCPRLSVSNNIMADMADLGIVIAQSGGFPTADYYSVQGNVYQGSATAISDSGTGIKKLVSNNVS